MPVLSCPRADRIQLLQYLSIDSARSNNLKSLPHSRNGRPNGSKKLEPRTAGIAREFYE